MSRWAETALAEWRRYREPRDTTTRTSAVRSVLSVILPKLGLSDAMDEQEIRRAWVDLVGPFIASQSAPDRLRGGVLHVRVHQSSVRFELERTWKAEITTKLAKRFGPSKIRELKFFG